jgi:hypothetical protein
VTCSRDSPWMNRFMGHLAQNGCTNFNFERAGLEVFSHSLGQNRSRASGAEFAQKLTFAVAPTRTKLEH